MRHRWKIWRAAMALSLAALGTGAILAVSATPASARYGNSIGMGVGGCDLSTGDAQAFFSQTPYYNLELYVGGSAAGCPKNGSYASAVLSQGWQVLPLWVGPQAPCTGYASRISTNGTTANNQGISEAQAAYNTIVSWGWDTADTPLIYDLEGFDPSNSGCLNSVREFLYGWDHQLHIPPAQKAGVYGSTCSSDLASYASLPDVPDFIDGASYTGIKSTWTMPCIPSSYWTIHQRHKQYQGDHDETWNGVTALVDSDCANGPVYPQGVGSPQGCA